MSQHTERQFMDWFKTLPGVVDYFGDSDLEAWTNGTQASVELQRLFDLYSRGDLQNVLAFVRSHVEGNTIAASPGFTNDQQIEDYSAELEFFANEETRIKSQIEVYKQDGNNHAGALVVLNQNLTTVQNAIAEYKKYQANAEKNFE